MDHKNNSSNSSSTFLLGFLLGIAAALLFTTKKGRQILRTFTDEGMSKFSEIESLLEKKMHKADEEELVGDLGDDYVSIEARMVTQAQESTSPARVIRPQARRIFKGVKRRSV